MRVGRSSAGGGREATSRQTRLHPSLLACSLVCSRRLLGVCPVVARDQPTGVRRLSSCPSVDPSVPRLPTESGQQAAQVAGLRPDRGPGLWEWRDGWMDDGSRDWRSEQQNGRVVEMGRAA